MKGAFLQVITKLQQYVPAILTSLDSPCISQKMSQLFPSITASKLQATTYLLGIAFFSISFLVFLNASISFVVTDVIGRKHGVGDAVGTLGFADELLALIMCPLWGLLSDRVGVRTVAVLGYLIIGVSLICLVQATDVYPGLLIGRLGFSVGGAACSTMVTAILPAMTVVRGKTVAQNGHAAGHMDGQITGQDEQQSSRNSYMSQDDRLSNRNSYISQDERQSNRNSFAPSVSSELTITPARYVSRSRSPTTPRNQRRTASGRISKAAKSTDTSRSGTSQLAGFVGMFTGFGALLAVVVFLPLPASIQRDGISQAQAIKDSFYIVGSIAIVVGILVYFGLRGLPGEENKSFRRLIAASSAAPSSSADALPTPTYFQLVRSALYLGLADSNISLGYIGGFVARASSVGISLFIPLFINAYFIRSGLCPTDPASDIKSSCRRAYTLAAMLTGISQLAALICAPLFGYINGRIAERGGLLTHTPLAVGAVCGVAGCVAFGRLKNPDPFNKDEAGNAGSGAVLAVVLLGISQIAAIVGSLGLLARGIQTSSAAEAQASNATTSHVEATRALAPNGALATSAETAPLLPASAVGEPAGVNPIDRIHLKGTIAGVYSLAGGAGILLLTKLGGFMFDAKSPGAPFYLLAGFNALLLCAVVVVTLVVRLSSGARQREQEENAG